MTDTLISGAPKDVLARWSLALPDYAAGEFFNVSLWAEQARIARSVACFPRTAVKACHSSGKTFLAAYLTLWWLQRYTDGKVLTTAPTKNQLRFQLWSYIRKIRGQARLKIPECQTTLLYYGDERFAVGVTTKVDKQDEGVRFQGFHGGHMLIILDEAPGVHPKINDAIEGAMASGIVHILRLGNPTIPSGDFYQAFKQGSIYKTFTIDAFHTPNLEGLTEADLLAINPANIRPADQELLSYNPIPHLVTRRWVWERIHEWGIDSPRYQARVRGRFPTQSEYSVFPIAQLEEACERESLDTKEGETVIGVDVAGPGKDETAICVRRRQHVHEQRFWPTDDCRGEVLERCKYWYQEHGAPLVVNVDCIGMGWYFYQHIVDWAVGITGNNGNLIRVNAINVGVPARDKERFANLRAELHWSTRERLLAGDISGLVDETTRDQLAGILYKFTPRGLVQIESKEDMRKRGLKSPDRAESVILAFAQEIPQATGGYLVYEDRVRISNY